MFFFLFFFYLSLSQWWDVGKVQIKIFCQSYTSLRFLSKQYQYCKDEVNYAKTTKGHR